MSLTSHNDRDTSSIVDFVLGQVRKNGRQATYVVRRMRNGNLRLYDDATSYAAGVGQVIQWGNVVCDYSPAAGDREGQPAEFFTVRAAEEYAKLWL